MSRTDVLLARIEELRHIIDGATERLGVQIRAWFDGQDISITHEFRRPGPPVPFPSSRHGKLKP